MSSYKHVLDPSEQIPDGAEGGMKIFNSDMFQHMWETLGAKVFRSTSIMELLRK